MDVSCAASRGPQMCLVRPQLSSGGAGARYYSSNPLPCALRTESRVCGTLPQDRTRQEAEYRAPHGCA